MALNLLKRQVKWLAIFGLLAPLAVSPAWSEEGRGGSVADGEDMATSLCSGCHAIGKTGDSPVGEAPPFRTFVDMWPLESLEEALAEGIMVGHPRHQMPVFKFSPSEIADLIAYMETLSTNHKPSAEEG